jgi:transposase
MLKNLNEERRIRRLGVIGRQLLEEVDRPALNALPIEPYEYCEWRLRRVGIDYHVEIDAHYYSVPYRFARAEVEARLTVRGVEIFCKGERIAVHLRMSGNRKHTMIADQMPSSHRRYAGWTIEPSGRTRAKLARRRRRSASRFSREGPTPSRAIAPASASSASPGPMAPSASRPQQSAP